MISVGIVGGTGYTGVELLRLLAQHEQAEVTVITSRGEQGRRLDDLYPNLRGHYNLAFTEPDVATLAACDIVFFATPHNVAMNLVPELLRAGARVIAAVSSEEKAAFARELGADETLIYPAEMDKTGQKAFAQAINEQSEQKMTMRGLFRLTKGQRAFAQIHRST